MSGAENVCRQSTIDYIAAEVDLARIFSRKPQNWSVWIDLTFFSEDIVLAIALTTTIVLITTAASNKDGNSALHAG